MFEKTGNKWKRGRGWPIFLKKKYWSRQKKFDRSWIAAQRFRVSTDWNNLPYSCPNHRNLFLLHWKMLWRGIHLPCVNDAHYLIWLAWMSSFSTQKSVKSGWRFFFVISYRLFVNKFQPRKASICCFFFKLYKKLG